MSATNTTTNLGLSQFVNTDVPAWRQDYNGDMLKIDNAYTADISSATAETSADPSDYMKFYDVSATTNKKILISDLLKGAKVEDLTDTDITTPVDDDGLVYDSTSQNWKNIPIMTKELEIKTGAHNLLRFPTLAELQALNTSGSWAGNIYTFGNVTYTIDVANETITVNCNGTGGNNTKYLALYNRLSKRYYVDNGDYKVNGVDSGVDGKFQIAVSATTKGATSAAWEVNGIDKEGTSFTYNSSQVDGLGVSIIVNENYAVDNVVVKPMIRYAIDKTTDHAPYAKTNRELTEDTRKIITITDTMPSSVGNKSVGGCPTGYILIGADVYNTSSSRWDSMPIGVFADRPAYITSYTDSTTTYARPYLESGGVTLYGGQTFRALFMKVN